MLEVIRVQIHNEFGIVMNEFTDYNEMGMRVEGDGIDDDEGGGYRCSGLRARVIGVVDAPFPISPLDPF